MSESYRQTQIASPIEYDASYEHAEVDELETIRGLMETMRRIREKTYADTGHPMRSVHVKSHGLLVGEMRILPNLPSELAQGVFSEQANHPLIMRLSTTPGDMLSDEVSTPRGCAIKILGVKGERLRGSETTSRRIL